MALTVHVDLVSAERTIHSGPAEMVFAPSMMGEVGILPLHAPMLAVMRAGEVRLREPGGEQRSFFVSGGILEVQPSGVTLLCDTVLRAEDIDEKEAAAARDLAERALKGERVRLDPAHAHALLAEAQAKLRVVRIATLRSETNSRP